MPIEYYAWLLQTAMTSSQNKLQASHESEVKKLHSDKKAVQRDMSSTKAKVKGLEEAKNKLEMEVAACVHEAGPLHHYIVCSLYTNVRLMS